jgi:hypothetical protein
MKSLLSSWLSMLRVPEKKEQALADWRGRILIWKTLTDSAISIVVAAPACVAFFALRFGILLAVVVVKDGLRHSRRCFYEMTILSSLLDWYSFEAEQVMEKSMITSATKLRQRQRRHGRHL